jgi:acetoin:2,6-dichlorophenolindophenol oxidoreductase subunit beta
MVKMPTQGEVEPAAASDTITFLEAIRTALHAAMAADERVFLYGQDIEDPFGGAFKASKGLSTAFPGRVRNAPICEDAMAGTMLGAALGGCRPVLEFQFADFSSVAFNQLVNNVATSYWRLGAPVPLTVRLPTGGTPGGGPFHSQIPESWYSHHPGLVVVSPSTPNDAHHMLRQAIALDDPVIFCEHKDLYFYSRGVVTEQPDLPLGKARRLRQGDACSLIASGAMSGVACEVADRLAASDIWCDVIDLRCIKPLDVETILESVARSGRVLVISEDFPWGGTAAEVLALIADQGFADLDAPPQRLTARDTPIPFARELYHAHRPTVELAMERVRLLLRY